MGPLTIFFFPGVSLLAIVPLQPRSHQCRANTTTAVTCGRINTHHRRCGVSTLTATTTAAAGTSLQRWQHRHRCLGRSNNRRKTVTAPMTMARWPPFFFSGAYTQPVLVTYWPVISSLLAIAPSQSRSHQGCPSTPIATAVTSTPWDPRCHRGTTALTTTTPASAPLQWGSSHGSTVTVTMTAAPPSPLPCPWQHPWYRWGCSNAIATAASPRPQQHPHRHGSGSTVVATRPVA